MARFGINLNIYKTAISLLTTSLFDIWATSFSIQTLVFSTLYLSIKVNSLVNVSHLQNELSRILTLSKVDYNIWCMQFIARLAENLEWAGLFAVNKLLTSTDQSNV